MKQNDISLVVVDAVSPSIEEEGDIALANIQDMVNFYTGGMVYNFNEGSSHLVHNGKNIVRGPKETVDISSIIDEIIPGQIILAGGSLGNEHYIAFTNLIREASKKGRESVIHIPFDCTYSFEQEYDSGESWTDGCIGNQDMPIFQRYRDRTSECGGKVIEPNDKGDYGPIKVKVQLWDGWQKMADDRRAYFLNKVTKEMKR